MRKLTVGVGIAMWLGCMAATCEVATASEQQVSVAGSSRAGESVRTGGHDVPLLNALEQIVPVSYSVNVPNAGAWASMPVNWHAGGSFVRVLGEVLSANPDLQAHVDTDLRIVTVSAVPQSRTSVVALNKPPEIAPPASLAPSEAAVSVPASSTASAQPASSPATSGVPSATIHPPVAIAPASVADSQMTATPVPAVALPKATTTVPVAGPPGLPLTVASNLPAAVGAPRTGAAIEQDAAAAPAPATQQVWEMHESDGSVRNALQRWAKEAGWQFIWGVPTDFTVDADATIHGSFEDALRAVVDALSNAQVPIQVVMYKANRVLRVIPKGAG